ncbi:MAG TPA: hypothetical protein DG754_08695, partial [Bacteroidales bacterium]|nr:hypothetical protein [Bacteroidales bacterium]
LPIPNREVKPTSADGTAERWESRSPPTFNAPILPFALSGLFIYICSLAMWRKYSILPFLFLLLSAKSWGNHSVNINIVQINLPSALLELLSFVIV